MRTDTRTSKHVAVNLDRFLVSNYKAPPAEFRAALQALELELKSAVNSAPQRLEIQRRCAELYFSQCITECADWTIIHSALKQLEHLGYSNVERRSHFAVLLANYSAANPIAVPIAKSRAQIALKKIRCLRKTSYLRTLR